MPIPLAAAVAGAVACLWAVVRFRRPAGGRKRMPQGERRRQRRVREAMGIIACWPILIADEVMSVAGMVAVLVVVVVVLRRRRTWALRYWPQCPENARDSLCQKVLWKDAKQQSTLLLWQMGKQATATVALHSEE